MRNVVRDARRSNLKVRARCTSCGEIFTMSRVQLLAAQQDGCAISECCMTVAVVVDASTEPVSEPRYVFDEEVERELDQLHGLDGWPE